MTNKERARDAATAIDAFVRTQEPRASDLEHAISQTPDEFLVDLLTDLRHWAHQTGVDYGDASRRSRGHFAEELDEEGERAQHEPTSVQIAESAPDLWEIVRLLAEREDADDPLIQDAVALVSKIEGGAA